MYLSLGTIKASQVVVLNEDMQLLLNENSYKQPNSNPKIEFNFVEKHNLNIKNVCGAQRSQIQFEDEDHAFYMSFR